MFDVTFTQFYAQEFSVAIQVNSEPSPVELENEIADLANNWRLPRLYNDEITSIGIQAYVNDSF